MQLSKFIQGLTILSKYYDKPDGDHIGAEHDQFFAWATTRALEPDDIAKMRELGWFQPDQEDGAGYDPTKGWSTFT